jgi:hypothetical protein
MKRRLRLAAQLAIMLVKRGSDEEMVTGGGFVLPMCLCRGMLWHRLDAAQTRMRASGVARSCFSSSIHMHRARIQSVRVGRDRTLGDASY